ncbi:MAG: amylo-alpha-1,6-glucosidase, partial [Candidatus Nanoarchaeia archaeon]
SLLKLEAGHDLLAKHLPRFPSENDFAKLAAMNSALSFRQDATYKGLYAGFPWFHQFWSRDELVSLKAFMDIGDYSFVKQVIFRYLEQIRDDGRLPNRFPHADLGSADSIGWLFKRIDDYLNALEKSRCLPRFLSFDELVRIKNRAEQVAYRILHCHSDDSLIINKGNETWMDTTVQAGNPRDGARLEVQALQLCIYRVMRRLCKITDDKMGMKLAEGFEKELKSAVRKSFWNGSYLKDGVDDDTIRPNIFIMYYICPDLLTKKEWNNCFDHILPKLWLDWGGLATIDKNSGRFCEETGGTTSSSYHDGDSWFWINNLAALCLKKHSWIRYRKYIDAIKKASVEEILWKGMLGHHSEISSADHLSSHGCFAQAWSAAMLLELL